MIQEKKLFPLLSIFALILLSVFITRYYELVVWEYVARGFGFIFLITNFLFFGKHLRKSIKKYMIYALVLSWLADYAYLMMRDIHFNMILASIIFSVGALFAYSKTLTYMDDVTIPIFNYSELPRVNLLLSFILFLFPVSVFIIEDLKWGQTPSILFQVIIWIFFAQSLKRLNHVNDKSYYLVLLGTLLYSVTSIIGTLNTYSEMFEYTAYISVLLIYVSHLFLVIGMIYQKK